MNTPIFHEIIVAVLDECKKLRPKISIFWKELNARLDANGRYTKKIVWTVVLFVVLILFKVRRDPGIRHLCLMIIMQQVEVDGGYVTLCLIERDRDLVYNCNDAMFLLFSIFAKFLL